MRYAEDSVVVSAERDIPLLRQVRNSKFVSHIQLFELMKFGGLERSRDSFNWRVRRLVKCESCRSVTEVLARAQSVYRITETGLPCSNITASSRPSCTRIPNICRTFRQVVPFAGI